MAAPSYTKDITDINLAELTTNWAEPTATGWTGGGSQTQDVDYPYIQGSYSVLQATSKSGVSALLYNNGSGITIPTDGAFLVWQNCYTPTLIDTYENGGLRVMVGSSLADFVWWSVGGSNAGRMPYGGWQNHAVNPTVAGTTVGSPTTTLQYIGAAVSLTAGVGKGYPHNIDAIRYGRCEARFSGGDLANGYCTFAGFAAINDANSASPGYNRWGLIQAIAGGYLWKGLMTLGYSSAVDFRDSNKIVFIDDTRKVTAAFNKIDIKQASSRVDWTGISFICTSPSTTASKGRLEVVDDADVNIESCTFTDMDTFIFQGSSTINGSVFRRCGQVTQGGAVFNGCTFDQPSGAVGLLSDDLNDIDNTTFISDGTGHAIELTSAHSGTSKTLTNVTFTGYALTDGSTGNEAIKNSSGGAVTITISGGTSPTVYNVSPATTTLVTTARTIKVIAQKADGTKVATARVLLRTSASASGGFPYDVTVTITNSGTTATVSHSTHGMLTTDKVQITGASHIQNNGVFSITKIDSNSYSYTMATAPGSNPTGTIKATYVFLEGTTDTNGEISTSREIGANQSVVGWARKASDFLKQGSIAGTVVTTGDSTFSAILAPDS